MRTFFAIRRPDRRLRLRRPHFTIARGLRLRAPARTAGRRLSARVTPGAQEGFLLVEVIVSALLVVLIVVATFNGFDVINRAQADDRAHDQAVILAAQSQEQLRTDPVTTLDALETTPHTYSQSVNGTTYEVTQEAAPSNGSANTTGCNAVETTKQTAATVQITSTVTWARLEAAKRPEVKLSSIITPPTGSGLEVDVGNAPTPTEGVPGVTAIVTFTPVNSTTPESREGTTDSAGCVVFGDIEATSATVEIQEKPGFITPNGSLKVPAKEVTLAPNLTVHDPVTYDEGGAIKADFTWEGKSVAGKLGSAPSGIAALGLIATNFVRVYHPCPSNTNKTGVLENPWIYAAILSTSHSFLVDNWECGKTLGNLGVYGAIAQKFHGPVATVGASGYLKDYIYDSRLATVEPPYFLSPFKTGWKVSRETSPTAG